jgi:hypothetical protein
VRDMNDLPKTIVWAGQQFSLRPLSKEKGRQAETAWAIWHGREFVGTLPYVENETTKEFELRSQAWFSQLIAQR